MRLAASINIWLTAGFVLLAVMIGLYLSSLLSFGALVLAAFAWVPVVVGILHAGERLPRWGRLSTALDRYAPSLPPEVKERLRREAEAKAEEERKRQEALAAERKAAEEALRVQRLAREQQIRAFYDNKMNVIDWRTGKITKEDYVSDGQGYIRVKMKMDSFYISRALTTLTAGDIAILTYLDIFRNYGFIDSTSYNLIKIAIIYNDGNCNQSSENYSVSLRYADKHGIKSEADAIQHVIAGWDAARKAPAIAAFLTAFSRIEGEHPDAATVREFRAKIIGGSKWLDDDGLKGSVFGEEEPTALFIGATETGRRVWFRDEGSLVSIAPSGSGKTQCHALPNLLSYRGPIMVLDIKGDCYTATADWRKANVGPVFMFSPSDPEKTARYNPLHFVSDAPDLVWEESRLLADLFIVADNQKDIFWESNARDLVGAIIAWIVRDKPPHERSISQIIDVISKVTWEQFIKESARPAGVPGYDALVQLATAFDTMREDTRDGILNSARRHFSVWQGERVQRATAACDWTPDMLRDGSNPTIYICIPPHEIESYAPLLRVLFAQHIRQLMRELPPREQTPILFMLDELPRLGPMKPVEEALEVGRQYGIRLWMIAQSLGQFEKVYENANGMVGNCAVRIFMNPSAPDGTTQRLSEELGYTESILDGSRRLMVEPADLAGPDYKDHQIVIARNTKPAKLKKVFAYNDPTFASRMPQKP